MLSNGVRGDEGGRAPVIVEGRAHDLATDSKIVLLGKGFRTNDGHLEKIFRRGQKQQTVNDSARTNPLAERSKAADLPSGETMWD